MGSSIQKTWDCIERMIWGQFTEDGGEGSGNHGHAGRPGKVGGSAPAESGGGSESKPRKLVKGETPKLKTHYPSAKDAIADAEAWIRKGSYEVGVLVSEDGKVLLNKTSGKRDEVAFSPADRALFVGARLTHNHPDGSTFSDNDIGIAMQDWLKEVRVCHKDGSWEALTRTSNKRPANWIELPLRYGMQWPMFRDLALGQAVVEGWGVEQANQYMYDMGRKWLEEHAPEYGWEYRRG